jgi:hypothetical protein
VRVISLTRLWPTRTLARFRLASLIFASLSVLPQVNRNLPTEYWLSGVSASLLLIPLLLITFLRQRPFWWEPVLIGPWIFLCGIVLETRPVVLGCIIGISASQSLYGSARSAGLRLLIVIIAAATVGALDRVSHDSGAGSYREAEAGEDCRADSTRSWSSPHTCCSGS